ncbi:LOW QUALITY PROTEIN: F-box only protein 40 [Chanos chanos]|uniref:LOW QUALITY PROTEIN: F-box only protein 40 n=1 Tax=Chanos chanos TaxID=29144 RepID=A0A6J2ULY6_CHACN|nr:LOW QUALITY PROTEIN: F-box only protein 40-like [Chanos chanos]
MNPEEAGEHKSDHSSTGGQLPTGDPTFVREKFKQAPESAKYSQCHRSRLDMADELVPNCFTSSAPSSLSLVSDLPLNGHPPTGRVTKAEIIQSCDIAVVTAQSKHGDERSKALKSKFQLSFGVNRTIAQGRNGRSSTELHKHCEKCFNRHCRAAVEISVSCVVISCRLHCGATFHLCKEDEHRLLCPNEKVPCLNAHYGCPFSMPRYRLAQHLEVCPASLVSCSLEWNRWPVAETDTTFCQSAVKDPNCMDQLDIAMALRDQKCLFSSIKMKTLFPELIERTEGPVNHESGGASGGDDLLDCKVKSLLPTGENPGEGADWAGVQELSQEEREALAKSKDVACLESYNMWEDIFKKEMGGCKQTVKNLESKDNPDGEQEDRSSLKNNDPKEDPQGDQGSSSSDSVDVTKTGFAPWQDGVLERLRKEANIAEYNMYLVHHGSMLINFGQLAACTPKEKDFVYGNLEPIEVQTLCSYTVPTSYRAKRNHMKDPSQRAKRVNQSVDTFDLGVSTEDLPKSDEVSATLLCSLEREWRGHQICETVATDGLYVDFGTQTYDFPSAPFKATASLADVVVDKVPSLHLQVQTECVTRRHNKASSAFTYLCCHTFRRDEYPLHFQNVHADIQSNLHGWFEQRCPLAYLGCTFSQRRFRPSTYRAVVTYNQDLGTFSLQPEIPPSLLQGGKTTSSEHKRARNLDPLSRLPFELLQHIAGFLDSQSLSQLSQVSQLMREVCGTLLHERGMVFLKWEKKTYSHGESHWKARKKVWQFSTLFSRVDKWRFEDMPSIAEHLRVCPFYHTESRSEPVALVSMGNVTDKEAKS